MGSCSLVARDSQGVAGQHQASTVHRFPCILAIDRQPGSGCALAEMVAVPGLAQPFLPVLVSLPLALHARAQREGGPASSQLLELIMTVRTSRGAVSVANHLPPVKSLVLAVHL